MSYWEKQQIFGKLSITNKELLLTIPNDYQNRRELNFSNFDPNSEYLFTFYAKQIVKIGEKIRISGISKDKTITVWHSAKLSHYFYSQIKFNLPVCFFGKMTLSLVSFFPEITKLNEGIFSVYNELRPLWRKKITEIIDNIKDQRLKLAFYQIHNPNNFQDVINGLNYLAKVEIAIFLKKIELMYFPKEPLVKNPVVKIDLELTNDQKKTIKEIFEDLSKPQKTVRVVYGDVGSGKTLIAIYSALKAIVNNKQVLYMAPTSLLAEQVYNVFQKFCPNLKTMLVTGKTSAKIKNTEDIEIFIGTHALIYKKYGTDIGLIIIDEQHRFGVQQRHKLIEDDRGIDIVMLTATPIPRTFQMMVAGHISVSCLKEKPNAGFRSSYVINNQDISGFVSKIIPLSMREKCIWICKTIKEAEERLDFFNKAFKLAKLNIGDNIKLIHGKMKNKKEVLDSFDALSYGLLISTTVIEVGIDINVNVIVIENADQFGYAQLHQLRGRVGRREKEGFCFFLGSNVKKLKDVVKADDNFSIAKLDFSKRGGGMICGVEQSGFVPFRFLKTLNESGKVITIDLTEELIISSKEITIIDEMNEIFSVIEEIAV